MKVGQMKVGQMTKTLSMASLPTGNSDIPEGWTVSNANVMP
jgi:hypothetical protein